MKQPRVFLGLLFSLLLANCTAAPTPTREPARLLPSPSLTASPTATPPVGTTLQPTWTSLPPVTPQPTSTPGEIPTRVGTPSPTPAPWLPEEIPSVTLTPTRSSAVPFAAERDYAAALDAYTDGNLEEALEFVEGALALAPDHCDFLTLRAQILVGLTRPLDAAADLRQALGIDPYHAPARRSLAELFIDYGRFRDAAAEYTRYLTLAPDDPDGWYALGQIREYQDRPLDAVAAYSQTLALEPTHVEGLTRRAALWLAQENYDAAWADYTALLAAAPTADAYFTRARINLILDAPLLAAADLEAGLSLQPGTPSYAVMMQLGQAYLQGGAALQAAETFSQTIGLTASVEPYLWLGESYLAVGDYPAAAAVLSDILPLVSPLERGRVLADRGEAYLGMADYQAALADLTEALDYARDADERASTLTHRSAAYTALEQYEEAIADLTTAHRLAPSPLLLYRRGILNQQAGHDQAAAADLAAFLENADVDATAPAILEDAQARLAELTGTEPESQSP
jgi:tetratricopeptide (TPR) repeat protein